VNSEIRWYSFRAIWNNFNFFYHSVKLSPYFLHFPLMEYFGTFIVCCHYGYYNAILLQLVHLLTSKVPGLLTKPLRHLSTFTSLGILSFFHFNKQHTKMHIIPLKCAVCSFCNSLDTKFFRMVHVIRQIYVPILI